VLLQKINTVIEGKQEEKCTVEEVKEDAKDMKLIPVSDKVNLD
jgi:hypothetical protein